MHSTVIEEFNNPSHTFNDGIRSIDYVLVWETDDKNATTTAAQLRRKMFEDGLESLGLQLEHEVPKHIRHLHFVKIHASVAVLRDYSEVLKLKLPMKVSATIRNQGETTSCWDRFTSKIFVNTFIFPKKKPRLTAVYSKDKEYLFDTTSKDFWTPSIRFRIVQFLLDRPKFTQPKRDDEEGDKEDDKKEQEEFYCGITRLLANGTYSAAYPLHDGDLKTPGTMRYILSKEWACLRKCLNYQPLDYLKDYFGVKIGLYFAWLGFYTIMLIPASVVGVLCILYSAMTVSFDKPSEEICNYNNSIKMCPSCDECDYWDLKDTCGKAKITHYFENSTTVFFAVFMSLWATCFLELWKRYSAEITHRWDLTGFDVYHEHPRPQYLAQLANVKTTKELNVVTGQEERKAPFWKVQFPARVMSYSIVGLLVLVVVASLLGVVFYRISLLGVGFLRNSPNTFINTHLRTFITVSAAGLNLVFIIIFGNIYERLAKWLTEKELRRTQTEFDDSLILKIYLLQFVNYYSSIFYIAFVKGKFVGCPGNYVRLFGQRQEECAAGGCLFELSIQLAIITIGKQLLNAIKEMSTPYILTWWKAVRIERKKSCITSSNLQWVKDYKLVDFETQGLFPEYLEMVLQFGFITIFVAAFPLAPLFALINNVMEIRLDAKKFITFYRRTVPQRINDIGVWYRILDSIGKLSIMTNALIIAFTSDFIPRLVYKYEYGSLDHYVEFSLSYFNTSSILYPPKNSTYNLTVCSYPNYSFYKPDGDYVRSDWYWHVLAARLAFVLIFQNVISLVKAILRWAIPDMPARIRDLIRQEAYVTNNIILEQIQARSKETQDYHDSNTLQLK